MAYEFKTLGSVEALTEVPENAHALVEVDGAIKRVPGGALGGGGGCDIAIAYDGSSNYTFVKGDHLQLVEMLTTGQCPRVCVFYAQPDGWSFCYTMTNLEYSNGSGVWINMDNGSNYFTICIYDDGYEISQPD